MDYLIPILCINTSSVTNGKTEKKYSREIRSLMETDLQYYVLPAQKLTRHKKK